jgi:hypothetical protein
MSPVGLGTKNHCADEDQQQFTTQFWLNHWRAATGRLKKLVTEAGDSSGTQRKGECPLFESRNQATTSEAEKILCMLWLQ